MLETAEKQGNGENKKRSKTDSSLIGPHYDLLVALANKYVWWQDPQKAVKDPHRVLAAAMNLGTVEDYQQLIKKIGKPALQSVLRKAAPGWFSPKAWSFWHRTLYNIPVSLPVPPPPQRSFS